MPQHTTPTVDDLLDAVGRSAKSEAAAQAVAKRMMPPPGGMVIPRGDRWSHILAISAVAFMAVVAGGTGWLAWSMRGAAALAGDEYRMLTDPPPQALPLPARLIDDHAFAELCQQRPREILALLHARCAALVAAGRASDALGTIADIERIAALTPAAQVDRVRALHLLGRVRELRLAAYAIDASVLSADDRRDLARLVEAAVLPPLPSSSTVSLSASAAH